MSEASNPVVALAAKLPWLKYLLHGVGGGTAFALGYAAIEAVKQRPEFLPQLLGGNVLFFAALVIGMVIVDRRASAFVDLQTRNVAAQEQLAAGVNALVSKDDERAREQDITLNYLARNSEQILRELKELKGQKASDGALRDERRAI